MKTRTYKLDSRVRKGKLLPGKQKRGPARKWETAIIRNKEAFEADHVDKGVGTCWQPPFQSPWPDLHLPFSKYFSVVLMSS
mmetsp:Transcript_54061/g.136571  ORF Transcript_54061/g.136571 Transcript_54061/m.136571 type:complete len:81 (+) Transcript_54061:117-359(+)